MGATFKKAERLTGKKVLTDLFQNGKAVKAYPFILLYKPCTFGKDVPARLAISIPKRRVKLAVKRNIIRRQVREVYRLHKQPLYDLLIAKNQQWAMLIIFVGNDPELEPNLVHQKITRLLTRLTHQVTEHYQAEKQYEKHKSP